MMPSFVPAGEDIPEGYTVVRETPKGSWILPEDEESPWDARIPDEFQTD